MPITVTIPGLDGAIADLARVSSDLPASLGRAMFRVGGLVKKTAVEYAPISPSTTMLRKFLKLGGQAGTTYTLKATRRRQAQDVTLTRFYADRLQRDYYQLDNPRSTTRPSPGGLMRSITFQASAKRVEIFVPANSPAGEYAFRIHEEFGVTWFHRGPGTQAKGPQAREKFIERAITDSGTAIVGIVRDEVSKSIAKAGGTA